ncbi:IS701 family transposase [Streptomyces sp. NPDC060184]|uniref:IS701 family transposase n=1 Tax=Streptomyces sp. NPDC060184 TaxID=3347064 RepID=UPI00364A14FF
MTTVGQTARGRTRDAVSLAEFSETLFAQLPRTDQLRWARVYLQGLLATPGRKSVRRMAEAVTLSPTASQSLQQFVNMSPWHWDATRQELARWIDSHFTAQAWTVVPAVLPKRGNHSVGVHQRFVPELERTVNCQLSVGIFLSNSSDHLPVGWRLHLPERWTQEEERRRVRVPGSVPFRPYWAHVVGLVEALSTHSSIVPAPVVADVGPTAEARRVMERLNAGGHGFALAVAPDLRLLPDTSAPLTPSAPGGPHAGENAFQRLLRSGLRHPHIATTAGPDGSLRRVQVASVPTRTPVLRADGTRTVADGRLFAEWDPARRRLGRIWITNLTHYRIEELLKLTALLQGATDTVTTLGEHHGIRDFEGRSYPGWHRHMTLVSAAYAYHRLTGAPAAAVKVRAADTGGPGRTARGTGRAGRASGHLVGLRQP